VYLVGLHMYSTPTLPETTLANINTAKHTNGQCFLVSSPHLLNRLKLASYRRIHVSTYLSNTTRGP
jgi:hypothetical protein